MNECQNSNKCHFSIFLAFCILKLYRHKKKNACETVMVERFLSTFSTCFFSAVFVSGDETLLNVLTAFWLLLNISLQWNRKLILVLKVFILMKLCIIKINHSCIKNIVHPKMKISS